MTANEIAEMWDVYDHMVIDQRGEDALTEQRQRLGDAYVEFMAQE